MRARQAPSKAPLSLEELRKRVEDAKAEVESCAFWLDLRRKLCDALLPEILVNVEATLSQAPPAGPADAPSTPGVAADAPAAEPVLDVVCYGIGSFAQSRISRDQLALALLLRDRLGVAASLAVFDPVLGAEERALLAQLGCEVIPSNEEGRRAARRATIFYMPHCPRRLYSNVLRANWGPALARILVIGNSFGHYGERAGESERRAGRSCLLRALPHAVEAGVEGAALHGAGLVFNDTALHAFPPAPAAPPSPPASARPRPRPRPRLEAGAGEWWERVRPPPEDEEPAGGPDDELVPSGTGGEPQR
eukprot:tig00000711_g3374.t1